VNVLITYHSLTGNTHTIALAIQQQVIEEGHQCKLTTVANMKIENLENYDVVFVGSACHDSNLAKPVLRLLDKLSTKSTFKLAGFVTHATQLPSQGERHRELYDRWAGHCLPSFQNSCEAKNIPFLGYFHCQGKPSSGIAEFIHKVIVTEKSEWETYITEVMLHPNEQDIANAKAFAQTIIAKS
jgi:flavodoxin